MAEQKVRFGIIGIGNIGNFHFTNLLTGKVPDGVLAAACDLKADRLAWARERAPELPLYEDYKEMIASGLIDTVIICVPHYSHPPIAIYAFEHGMNVVCEKPIGVYTEALPAMFDAAKRSGKVFSMMFNQRTNPAFAKMREIVQSGELGEIKRTVWLINNWYRSQAYYNSGSWRATWAGEGGGVLLNQCPHNLDLWQWICGMPTRVRAFCKFGHYHDIEVEDDVTAYVEYANGASGVFMTSTAEAPGVNRLEIFGDMGRLTYEGTGYSTGKLTFCKLRESERKFCVEASPVMENPKHDVITYDTSAPEDHIEHVDILRNVTDAILHGAKLIAPGEEGIHQLTLTNAMLLSQWTDNWVDLPINAKLYHELLKKKAADSRLVKHVREATVDVSGTF